MTVNDGGIMHTSSFCNGLWNRPQAIALRHRIIRRNPMEVALYMRVSTSRQQQHQTIEQQLRRLRDYVATHPDWYVADEHIYRDDGYSGATLKRPGLDRLRDRAAMAAFECVLLTAPDRLARNYVHQMLLVDELTQRGCRVEFVERPMSDDPHDQLLLQIRSAVAEYERTLIAERMRRGRQAQLRSGQLLPWTRAPYGYLLDPDRPRDASRVRLDPVQAAVVEQMFAWYTDTGQAPSLYQVAKRLSDAHMPTPRGGTRWNVASVRGILRSPTYMGVAYSGRTHPAPARRRKSALQPVGPGQSQQPAPAEEWIAVPVPAIISEETFEAAQHRLNRNVQMARRNNTAYTYLLRGLVSCGQCRLACGGRTLHPGYHYYFCRGRTDALRLALGERCTARYAPAQALDALVWQDLCRVLSDPALITHELERAQMGAWLPQALHARRQTLRDVLAQLERQQARLLDLYLAEVIEREEFARRRKEVAQSQQGLTQQLRQLDTQAQQHVNVAALSQGIEAFCQRLQPTLDQLTFAQRRQLVELLIDRVIVNDTQVEIRYGVPTGPKGETTPFCHLRLDYLNGPTLQIQGDDPVGAPIDAMRHQYDIRAGQLRAFEAHYQADFAAPGKADGQCTWPVRFVPYGHRPVCGGRNARHEVVHGNVWPLQPAGCACRLLEDAAVGLKIPILLQQADPVFVLRAGHGHQLVGQIPTLAQEDSQRHCGRNRRRQERDTEIDFRVKLLVQCLTVGGVEQERVNCLMEARSCLLLRRDRTIGDVLAAKLFPARERFVAPGHPEVHGKTDRATDRMTRDGMVCEGIWGVARVRVAVHIVEQTADLLAQGVIQDQGRVSLRPTYCLRLLE
jgi:site-specific DNA recombinase